MRFNISNDPNYEENQKRREYQAQLNQQRLNQMIQHETNIDLDIIQYKLDNNQYYSWYTRNHFWEKKRLRITLDIGYRPGYAASISDVYLAHNKLRKISGSPKHLGYLVETIHQKYPKWKVSYWNVTHVDYIDYSGPSWQAGKYGITITCYPEDFPDYVLK